MSLNNLHARGIVDLNPSSRSCNVIQHEVQKLDSFIYGEELAYIQTKKCQACARCTRCPTLATLSFKEMHELHLIEENVAFNEELGACKHHMHGLLRLINCRPTTSTCTALFLALKEA